MGRGGEAGIRISEDSAASCLQKAGVDLEGYDVPEHDTCALFERLDAFARAKVEAAAREAANTALPRMKDRFNDVCLPPYPSPHLASAMLRRPHCIYQAVAPGVSSG